MLRLDNASLRRGAKLLFQDASLQVHRGQRVGLIGINGSGKSSLFALVLGELETDLGEIQVDPDYAIAHVDQQSPNTGLAAIEFVMDGDRELRKLEQEIGRLEAAPESPRSQARLHELRDRMDVIDGYTATTRAARLISGLGFAAGDERRPVNEFSGGWRMRLNLAQALMCRSDILLLDEPTNHLDLPAILWLERWLKSYQGILLVISHDRDFLDSLCTHIAHIEHQAINSYTGNYSQFERIRSEQLALQQSMHEKQQREIRHIQRYVDRFRYKASKARQAQSRLKMLEKMTVIAAAHVDSQFHFQFYEPKRQPQHLLSLDKVDCGYETPVVSGVNLEIAAGSRIGLLGVNGAGKSTLLKTLVDGSTMLSGERTLHRHTRIAYFAQHQLDLLRMDCSPMWHVQQQAPDLTDQELRNHLGKFGFRGERIDEPVSPFSGGEKARLVLAVMILQQPNLLLLDEPTNHLDLEMRHALSMALVDYSGAMLVISHDRHLLRTVCDELYMVHDGELMEFRHELDEYPAWLRDQALASSGSENRSKAPPSRKEQRQQQALMRQQLQPLTSRVRQIEKKMTELRKSLEQLDSKLSEERFYADPSLKDALAELVQEQGANRKLLESLEWEWLEASEQLENAQQQFDSDQRQA
ncbi:MAG: ATP-binding cassette domain-containing protein [Gammaproteobacteria bacterium]|nr:ATP-binding cassette domain-containing protein [Gammaproteobacteria bacterium]